MTLRHLPRQAASALALPLLLAACGGGGSGSDDAGAGTLRVSLTDAPACGYDSVHVTVEKLRVHRSASAAEGDAGWAEVVLTPPRRIDLLTLTNGVLEPLGQTALPAGTYTQMRLVLAPNGSSTPPAHAVRPSGGAEVPLDTPSGQQSGIKLNMNVDVPAGKVADVVLDFDACKSVVQRGNSGRYNLKPVIAVVPVLADAGLRIEGWLDPALDGRATQVSAQAGGSPVKATVPDATGRFVLYPVPAGRYDLVVNAAGRVTAVMTGVPVTSLAPTQIGTPTQPLVPPPRTGPLRDVAGTVTPPEASVRALQALTGGPVVEVAWLPVDPASGAFAAALPVDPPWRAAYAGVAAPITFTADVNATGRYRLEAALNGAVRTQDVLATVPVPPVTLTLP